MSDYTTHLETEHGDRVYASTPRVRLKLLHPSVAVPKYADLALVVGLTFPPGAFGKVALGIAIQLPPGFEAQIRPRSSLSAMGIVCAFGTIDQGYTGELAAVLYNLSGTEVTIEAGQRICQLVIAPVARASFVEAETFDATDRGENGWGSTDTR
jgi:dUTP pyrophosphatase